MRGASASDIKEAISEVRQMTLNPQVLNEHPDPGYCKGACNNNASSDTAPYWEEFIPLTG